MGAPPARVRERERPLDWGAAVLLARAASDLLVVALATRLVVTSRVHSPAARTARGRRRRVPGERRRPPPDAHAVRPRITGPSRLSPGLRRLGSAALHPSAAEFGRHARPSSSRTRAQITLASASVLIRGSSCTRGSSIAAISSAQLLFGFAGVGFVVARLALGLRTVEHCARRSGRPASPWRAPGRASQRARHGSGARSGSAPLSRTRPTASRRSPSTRTILSVNPALCGARRPHPGESSRVRASSVHATR